MIIEGNPGRMSEEEIRKRFSQLEKLKIHPRDKSINAEIISRLERAYENQLGDQRQLIGQRLREFTAVLESQNDTDITAARTDLIQWLDAIENTDFFS